MDPQAVLDDTRRWIAAMVIGLNLCPFARRVFQADKICYLVSAAANEQELRAELRSALCTLAATPLEQVETTLLIHPHVLRNFRDYNEFLDVGDGLLEELGLRGIVQLASFHPDYQFAGTPADAVENYTNRSPYPMLHLLREESIAAAASDSQELLAIPQRNVATLRRLGLAKIVRQLQALADGSES